MAPRDRQRLGEAADDEGGLVSHCAWCDRIAVAGRYVAAAELLDEALPDMLGRRSTHGICPDCLRRELKAADAARARKRAG